MRKVDRGTVSAPSCLTAKDKQGKTEKDRAQDHQNNASPDKGTFDFAVYKHEEVKKQLALLFHGKCAYCETFYPASTPVDIEHYRPKGAVSEDPQHPGYWWLGMSWENLLPSCIDCNRRRKQRIVSGSTSLAELYANGGLGATSMASVQSGKKDSFPLVTGSKHAQSEKDFPGTEVPLLLDPSQDDPREHLHFHIDHKSPLGLILAGRPGHESERGATSIQIYGLNRLGLVQERTRVLRQLEFLGNLAIELGNIIEELKAEPVAAALMASPTPDIPQRLQLLQDRIFGEMRQMAHPTAPYSEMVRSWIDEFVASL
ncbi:hypothetical protein [Paracidovorax valerianellae]|uniref:TIGR02646 family protein n=1 Tax=Paracidovorax valerianellae TaxID=187868 RepID=A0A1G6LML2_9BURK|nr:hypothetical protein [Paracidovorax valerianellae]MDA8446445.1 hypothetical protein [Paracidovorax valerianellae]SDC43936.1 TIGR02646 family protein [Paracidovorax valerianellae]